MPESKLGVGPARVEGSILAAAVLSAAATLAPWPFGSTTSRVFQALSVVLLLAALLGVIACMARRRFVSLPAAIWPLGLFIALEACQLVPIPHWLHSIIAPGSAAYWHPPDPVARAVLGGEARPVSIDPGSTLRSLAFALGLATLVVLAVGAITDRRVAWPVTLTVVLTGTAVAGYGIVARALFGSLLFGRIDVPTVTPFGPFVSKNHFAGHVEMITLLAMGVAVGLADQARRGPAPLSWVGSRHAGAILLAAGASAVTGLAVLVSMSRGGVISLLAGLATFVGMRLVYRRNLSRTRAAATLATPLLCVLTAMLLLPSEGRERIVSLAGGTREASGSFRLGIWRDALRASTSSPIVGFGLGTFADALPRYKTGAAGLRVEHAENDYLELLTETGILGFLIALALVAAGAASILRGVSRQGDRGLCGLAIGAFAAITAFLVHAAFDFNFHIPANAVLFALVATIALASARPSSIALHPLLLAPVALVLLAGLWSVTSPEPPSFLDLANVRRARVAGADSPLRLAAAESELVASLGRRPADAEAWLFLAWLRGARGRVADATALSSYAVSLDPRRQSLRNEAARLQAASR
jgi:O-antigen ligase